MRLRRRVARLVSAVLAGAILVAVTGNGRSSAEDIATPPTEAAPYTHSVHIAYSVRPDYLLDFEVTVEYRIGTQAAAEELAQERISVNEHFDDLQIVEAATLKADGRRLDVPPGRIMTKSSSDDGEALFDADETIRIIIFPDVSPGDRIRYVARYRAKKPWLPGGFEIDRTASPWYRHSDFVVSLNAPVDMKLHSEVKGFSHSERHRSGRAIHVWTLAPLPYRPAEPAAVAVDDHGPYLRISSFGDLQAAGAVFCGRAEPASASTPAIARFANQITEGISSRREQSRAIFDWVASNIRYVSISLGTGGMVPHPAESILHNRYGDCKDHATLMRALLAAKGIRSEYALINSAPIYKDYGIPFVSYDHIILYLPEFDLYVDPTATLSTFDQLPYYLANKPALRCGYGKSALARVPA
jgi:transglutaminase-like putative cysteine protease